MPDETHSYLVRGVAAAEAGDEWEARFYLEKVINLESSYDEKLEAWFWLGKISHDPVEKRNYFDMVLANRLGDARARRELAILNGELREKDIIDPDRIAVQENVPSNQGSADRFTCPTCGGRMSYTPDGHSLTCDFCEARQMLEKKKQSDGYAVKEENFVAALSTAQGHLSPSTAWLFTCEGCGANFTAQPEQLSMVCPFCASNYVIRHPEKEKIYSPNGIIPFKITEKEAKTFLREWFAGKSPRMARGQAIYIPIWLFDVAGELTWRYQVYEQRNWVSVTPVPMAIHVGDIPVLATHNLPDVLQPAVQNYIWRDIEMYDPRFLANWPAETFQVALGDASLIARQIALENERERFKRFITDRYTELHADTSQMIVNTFRLILVPVWLTHYIEENYRYDILINGQTGEVYGEHPENGIQKFFGNLFSNGKL